MDKSSGSTMTEEDSGKCAECREEVKDSDKAIECDICRRWVHIKCGKITNAFYGELKKATAGNVGQGIRFLCICCAIYYDRIKVDIKQLMELQRELEIKQGVLTKGLEDAKRDIVEVKESLKKVVEDRNQEDVRNTAEVKVVEEIGELKL